MAFTTSQNYNTDAPKVQDSDAIEWGQEITFEEVPDYITLKPGEYDFTVKSFERGFYNGGKGKDGKEKSPCGIAKVVLEIKTDDGTAQVRDSFFMKKSVAWKIGVFFQSLGLAKPGTSFVPDFSKTIGCTGRVKTKNREYNGKTYNDVDRYITKK